MIANTEHSNTKQKRDDLKQLTLFHYHIPQVLVSSDGGHILYRGTVTPVCVARHTQVVVTIILVEVKDVDR